MGLIAQAIADANNYLTNSGGWAIEATFVANNTDHTTATINALCIKHNTKIDPETGLATNSTVARVTVSESALTDEDYPVRNSKGDVAMINHKVTWSDTSGEYTYIIRETWPDETLGTILFVLATFKS